MKETTGHERTPVTFQVSQGLTVLCCALGNVLGAFLREVIVTPHKINSEINHK